MTLARTALRLAALASLKGIDNSGPTIAGPRVYDSRITDFQPEEYLADAMPSVIVMTDADEGEALSRQNGGPPFHRLIDLVFEIGMVQSVQDGTSFTVGYPDTDARLEASLDLLEYQIARRLAYDPAPFPVLFRKFVRPRKHECHRQVLDDAGVKIACRLLTWTCEVNDDQDVVYASGGTVPTGINALPQPLQMVAAALTAGSAAADIATAIAAALAPLTITPLAGIDGTLTVGGSKDASNTINTAINMTGTST